MKHLIACLFLVSVSITCAGTTGPCPLPEPRPLRNLFSDWMGQPQEALDARLDEAWRHYFEGDPETQRLYYEVEGDMAYIWDVNNDDVRSEGMSYGMMIAVHMDRREAFNRLWKWAVLHMRHEEGPLKGYFAWHCRRDGTRLSQGPAPDGEEWFAMSLLLA